MIEGRGIERDLRGRLAIVRRCLRPARGRESLVLAMILMVRLLAPKTPDPAPGPRLAACATAWDTHLPEQMISGEETRCWLHIPR